MKQLAYIIALTITSLACTSCYKSEVEDLYDQSPEERTKQAIEKMRTDLMESELGWYAEYTFYLNDGSAGETELVSPLIFQFKANDRVNIKSVYEDYEQKESSYQLKYAQQIDLIFDTYSVFSYMVDEARHADFRWELDSVGIDKYYFTSRAAETEGVTYLTLERATTQTAQNFEKAQEEFQKSMAIQDIKRGMARDGSKPYFRNLHLDDLESGLAFDYVTGSNMMTFKGVLGGSTNVVTFGTKVTVKPNGEVVLDNPFNVVETGKFIRSMHFDLETKVLKVSDSDGWKGEVVYENKPAFESVGLAKLFSSWTYCFASRYSNAMIDLLNDVIRKNINGYETIQLYNNHISSYDVEPIFAILIYTDPAPDNVYKWDGIEHTEIVKLGEDRIYYDNSKATAGFRGAKWFEEVYNANENLRAVYDDFFCNPEGLYLDYDVSANTMTLVSKADPTQHITFQKQ